MRTTEKYTTASTGKKGNEMFNNSILDTFVSKQLEVGEHSIHYDFREGSKNPERTYVLVHGALSTGDWFKPIAQELAIRHPEDRILIVDQPWHRYSTAPKEQLEKATVFTYADVLGEFVLKAKELDIIKGKLSWAGWSMGGSVGMILSLKGIPLDELTLVNSSPSWQTIKDLSKLPGIQEPEKFDSIYDFIFTRVLDTNLTEQERAWIIENYDNLVAQPEVSVHDIWAIFPENYNIEEQLKNIQTKTLIVSGNVEERTALVEFQTVLKDNIPRSALTLFPDNHMMLVKPKIAKQIVEKIDSYFY